MLQEIIAKVKKADTSKELWLYTETFNCIAENATKVILQTGEDIYRDHMLVLQIGDDSISVSFNRKVWTERGYSYVRVIKTNDKEFPEYEKAAVVL